MAELIVLTDIGQENCEPVAGVVNVFSWAESSAFETIVDPKDICGPNAALTYEELIEIPAPGHTMKANKKLHKVTFTTETGAVKSTMIGNRRNRLFENTIEVKIAGSNAALLGFIRYIKNKDCIFFIEEFGSGNVRQFGSSRLPAWVDVSESVLEALIEGANDVSLTLKDKQKWPAAIYLGTLDYVGTP